MENSSLIKKYDIPTPRYTSYPTVPYWNNETINKQVWENAVINTFTKTNKIDGISLYIHLPYCESLCTFCGCNKKITKNHEVEEPYIQTLLKEWELYLKLFQEKPRIKEIHIGGGTPTFFSSKNLTYLIESILKNAEVAEDYEFSFEGHPNHTSREQLETMYKLGFKRVSFGVQDFDEKVQVIINRIQPYEQVKLVSEWSKEIGYDSINFDLVYGLPMQKEETIIETISKIIELNPDRLAFYSYAHVPWKSKVQRLFTESDLPSADNKRRLYELGRELFEKNNYVEIGMDHFSKPTDTLYKAMLEKKLHRNFMGYTTNSTKLLIGLGVSSISDTWSAYIQNTKELDDYISSINKGEIPISTGHFLDEEELVIKQHILNLMCNFTTSWGEEDKEIISKGLPRLKELEADNLVKIIGATLEITETGRTFVRNICTALDNKLWENKPTTQLFSRAI